MCICSVLIEGLIFKDRSMSIISDVTNDLGVNSDPICNLCKLKKQRETSGRFDKMDFTEKTEIFCLDIKLNLKKYYILLHYIIF